MSKLMNFLSRFKGKNATPEQQPAEAPKHLPKPIDLRAKQAEIRALKVSDTSPRYKIRTMPIPPRQGGYPLRHVFDCPFTPMDGIDVKNDILISKERRVTLGTDGSSIVAFYDAVPFGTIYDQEKAAMMSDWLDKGLPYSGILRKSGDVITLCFYANQIMDFEDKSRAIFTLTQCDGEAQQHLIGCMEIGEELTLEADPQQADTMVACYDGTPIGTLPDWAAESVRGKGIQTAYLEKTEDDRDFHLIPTVSVYW